MHVTSFCQIHLSAIRFLMVGTSIALTIQSSALGGASPGQKILILIKEKDRDHFPSPPEKLYTGKTVCVKGPVEMQNGQALVVVKDPGQIIVQQ